MFKVNVFVAVDLLQMLEFNVTVSFPAAPLLTVILALVGKYIFLLSLSNGPFMTFHLNIQPLPVKQSERCKRLRVTTIRRIICANSPWRFVVLEISLARLENYWLSITILTAGL